MGLKGRVGDQGLHSSQAFGKRDQPDLSENLFGDPPVGHLERDDRAESPGLGFEQAVTRVLSQAPGNKLF